MIRGSVLLACVALVLGATLTTACDGDDDGAQPTRALDRTPAATTTAGVDTPGPGDMTTGIRSVDAAVAAVLAGDETTIREMLVYQLVPCVTVQEGLGAPPQCREDEAEGTPVEVLPGAQCEGFFVRPGDVQLTTIVGQSNELYAVYRTPAGYFPAGAYTAVFARGGDAEPPGPPPGTAFEVVLDNEGVTGINYGCAEDAPQLVQTRQLTDAIVGP